MNRRPKCEGIVPGLSGDEASMRRPAKPRVRSNIFDYEVSYETSDTKVSDKRTSQLETTPEATPEPQEKKQAENDIKRSNEPTPINSLLLSKTLAELKLYENAGNILIKNAVIVNPDGSSTNDVLIQNGIIMKIEDDLVAPPNTSVFDAQGKQIMPGGIDLSTYFHCGIDGIQTNGDFASGSMAALAGGTTTIIDVVHCPRGSSPLSLFEEHRKLAASQSMCDYNFIISLSEFNECIAMEMETLVIDKGITAFQFYTGYKGRAMMEDDHLYDALKLCRRLGAVAFVQPENGSLIYCQEQELIRNGIKGPEGHSMARSEENEAEAAWRIMMIAHQAKCPIIISPVGNSLSAGKIATAKREGKLAMGVSNLSTLALAKADSLFSNNWVESANHVVSPKLQNSSGCDSMVGHLSAGDVSAVCSSHRAYRVDQKALGNQDFRKIPEGIVGVEERLPVLWEKAVKRGLLDPSQFVAAVSSIPAQLMNFYPRKGRITVGAQADLVIWNNHLKLPYVPSTRFYEGLQHNPYKDVPCSAGPELVIARGKIVANRSLDCRMEVHVTPGSGQFDQCRPFPQILYAKALAREKIEHGSDRTIKPIAREPYFGLVAEPNGEQSVNPPTIPETPTYAAPSEQSSRPKSAQFSPPTYREPKSGIRNQQQSSFSFSGEQIDDNIPRRSMIRTKQPPGGASNGPLW